MKNFLRLLAFFICICMIVLTTTACKKDKDGNESEVGGGYSSKVEEDGPTFSFDRDASVDTNIGINNSNISEPSVDKDAEGASIVNRTEIEGVDGTFYDVELKETKMDLKGREIIFGAHYKKNYEATGSADAQRCYKALKKIEEDYNCKIKLVQFIGTTEGAKQITTDKASGKLTYNVIDLLSATMDQIWKKTGLGADLRNVKTVGVETNPWNPTVTLMSSYKSGVYGVAVRYDRIEQSIVYFNKALAEQYQLGDFYELVRKGEWTTDKLKEICQQFKEKSGGSKWAFQAMFPQHYFNFIYANWSSPVAIVEENGASRYVFNGNSSNVLDMLSYVQDCVTKGLFNPAYTKSTIKDGKYTLNYQDYLDALANFNDGNTLFFLGTNGDATLPKIYSDAIDDYGILPMPMGPNAANYSTFISGMQALAIIEGDPYIEEDGAILTAIANRTNVKVKEIEKRNKSLVRDSQSLTMLTQSYKFKQILEAKGLGSGYAAVGIPCMLDLQSSPKQAMESIANSCTASINEYYKQQ